MSPAKAGARNSVWVFLKGGKDPLHGTLPRLAQSQQTGMEIGTKTQAQPFQHGMPVHQVVSKLMCQIPLQQLHFYIHQIQSCFSHRYIYIHNCVKYQVYSKPEKYRLFSLSKY